MRLGTTALGLIVLAACGPGTGSGDVGIASRQVTFQVAGHGSIRPSSGQQCRDRCVISVANGTHLSVTAAADDDSTFAGWGGACNGTGACEVVADRDLEIDAAFSLRPAPPGQHVLTAAKNGSGTVQSSPAGIDCGSTCSAAFADGTAVTLSPTADSGWRFEGWGGACSGSGGCAVRVSADATVWATFVKVQTADECDGLTPAALPGSVVASLPQNSCLSGTSDDGTGNFLLGYTAGTDHMYPNYLFFTVRDGKAERIGDTVPGGDNSATFVFSQPSGFTSFHVLGISGASAINSYSHEGVRTSTLTVSEGEVSATSPWSGVGIDPSGGTAVVRTSKDGSGNWIASYRRLSKTGGAETDWVTIDQRRNTNGAVGVSLSGHALVLEPLDGPNWQARWLAREGTPLTDWFPFVAEQGFPELQFLMDGSLVLRFRSPTSPFQPGAWKYRFEDAKAVVSSVPEWLAMRVAGAFYVVRGGRGYASWGGQGGQCGSRLEVLAASGKSCGCLDVPNLGDQSSVGRDGSLIVPRPPAQRSTCQYDLYQQVLK